MPTPSKRTTGSDSNGSDRLFAPAACVSDTGVEIGDLGAEGPAASDSPSIFAARTPLHWPKEINNSNKWFAR